MSQNFNETNNKDRKKIINAHESGFSAKEIEQILDIKRTTILGIIKTYVVENRIEKKPRGKIPVSKINEENKEKIKSWLNEDCSLSLKKIKEKCLRELEIEVSESTISRVIKGFFYTLKRIKLIPRNRNEEETIEKRYLYANQFMLLLSRFGQNKIIFLDEVGFSVSMRARRGRSLIGLPATQIVPALRSRNISICCGISNSKIIHYMAKTRAYNSIFFKEFLQEIIIKLRQENLQNMIIILDNVPFHHNLEARNMIETAGHAIFHLPPYSPFYNPIENMFAAWKENIRRANPQNEADLMEKIQNVASTFNEINFNNFFNNMLDYIRRGLQRQAILD